MIFLQKLVLGRAGFGLVEILITAGAGLVLGAGMLTLFQNSLQNSSALKVLAVERDLSSRLREILNNPADCKWNLTPGRTGGLSSDGTGALSALKKTNGSTNPSDYKPAIEKGVFKGKLEVVKLEFSGSANERTFTVYYKRKGLKVYNTLGGGACATGDTSGCYFESCKVNYTYSGTTVNTCALLNCAVDEVIKSVSKKTCGQHQNLRGFDKNGEPVCKPVAQAGDICPAGQFLKHFDGKGKAVCETACSAGATWKGSSCVCLGGRIWNGSTCTCLHGKYWDGSKCVADSST